MFIQMSRVWMITNAALLIALAANGNAQIVFNNLSAMDTFAPAAGVGIGKTPSPVFTYAGAAFVPQGRNYFLTKIEIPLQLISGPNELNGYVMSDANGLPSGVVEAMRSEERSVGR